MEFNDGSQYRVVTDPAAYAAQRTVFVARAASARGGVPYVDTSFAYHRDAVQVPALCWYQYVYTNAGTPEAQADYLIDAALRGALRGNEMVMVDLEVGGGFTAGDVQWWAARWLARAEGRLQTRAWVYVPGPLAGGLPRSFTADRIVMAPRYSGTAAHGAEPAWPWDVHQYTDRGPFPGCAQTGDTSHTDLTAQDLLTRCNPMGADPCHS